MSTGICLMVSFMAGSDLGKEIEMAKEKASKWGVDRIQFYHNTTHFSIGRNANVVQAIECFHAIPNECRIKDHEFNYVCAS